MVTMADLQKAEKRRQRALQYLLNVGPTRYQEMEIDIALDELRSLGKLGLVELGGIPTNPLVYIRSEGEKYLRAMKR